MTRANHKRTSTNGGLLADAVASVVNDAGFVMFCTNCHIAYSPGIRRCPTCSQALKRPSKALSEMRTAQIKQTA